MQRGLRMELLCTVLYVRLNLGKREKRNSAEPSMPIAYKNSPISYKTILRVCGTLDPFRANPG